MPLMTPRHGQYRDIAPTEPIERPMPTQIPDRSLAPLIVLVPLLANEYPGWSASFLPKTAPRLPVANTAANLTHAPVLALPRLPHLVVPAVLASTSEPSAPQ